MNSRQTIQLLMFMIALLLLFVFFIMSQQMGNNLSSAHDHVNNNILNRDGNLMSPEYLRGRFKSYDLGHPSSHLADPIDKLQIPKPEEDSEAAKVSGRGDGDGGEDAKGDDVLPSFLQPQVMSPPLQVQEQQQQQQEEKQQDKPTTPIVLDSLSGKGGQQREVGGGEVSSPTMSSNDHLLPGLAIPEHPNHTLSLLPASLPSLLLTLPAPPL